MVEDKPTPIQNVIRKLGFKSKAAFARELKVDRSCPSEWERRLRGNIPSRHWLRIIDMGEALGVPVTIGDLTND